jgi:predicted kinase
MADSLPLLVIVTGAPATGKTTIAQSLSKEMGLPLIAKDAIKEELFDSLGSALPSDSHELGFAAIRLMMSWSRTLLQSDVSMIVESNFKSSLSTDDLRELFEISRPVLVQCIALEEDVLDRYVTRVEEGERHPVHDDADQTDELREDLERDEYDLRYLDVPSITINTSEEIEVDIADLATRIRAIVEVRPDR